jgi:hypothetical protein
MADAPKISLSDLRGYISDAGELTKGTQIADSGALRNLARHEHKLFCEAKGSGQAPYRVSLIFGEGRGELKARCSCMAARSRPFCKHSSALLVAWARSPESFVVSDAPPIADELAKKKTVKTGKASAADLMKQGVDRVATLVRELAVAGIASTGADRVEQVRQLAEGLRENRLRRLSARTLELAQLLEAATASRGHVDAVAYADVLADMLLTARKIEKHLGGEPLDDRYVEELIGKSWRKNDRTPADGLELLEYAFVARVTADEFVIRESRFIDLRNGTHYTEKQILPGFLAKRTVPKRSYARSVLSGASGGIYPGFAPHRLDLETTPDPVAVQPNHVAMLAERAHAHVAAALAAFQEHRKDVFAPDTFPVSLRVECVVAEHGRLRIADAAGDALHLPLDSRLDDALAPLLMRGRLRVVLGDLTLNGILATLIPMAVVIETPEGLELVSLADAARAGGRIETVRASRSSAAANDVTSPAWLDEARRAGAPSAAIALGEVRLEMADALVTGLSGLASRVTDPLVSRLADLGLDKPAALLRELPARPDPSDRLDGFVKVHQVAGLVLVRLASSTRIDADTLERLPRATSIAIQRPTNVLTPEELLAARMARRLSRYEAAWHRARHYEQRSVDELLTEWPAMWSDGEAAPFVAERVGSAGDRAVAVAKEVLEDDVAGQAAQLTAIRVLAAIDAPGAASVLTQTASNKRVPPIVRARASAVSGRQKRGWRTIVPFIGQASASIDDQIDRLTTAADKDSRLSALEAIERHETEQAIPAVRHAWRSDPAHEVRARAAMTLGVLGDLESVEALIAAFRDRADASKEPKGALGALSLLADVRAVPDMLQAVIESWAGPLAAESLQRVGIAALEPTLTLVTSRPELAQRDSLQELVRRCERSPQAGRLLSKRMQQALAAPDGTETAAALLKLASQSESLRQMLADQVLASITAAATKAEKALVRAAQHALAADAQTPAARR